MKYSRLILILGTMLVVSSCATTSSRLTDISLKMTKSEVRSIIGPPESVAVAFTDDKGEAVEVLEYRLYQYSGAIEGLSPYFNIYSLVFVNDSLVKWMKTQENARLTEQMALEIVRGNRTAPQNVINIKNVNK